MSDENPKDEVKAPNVGGFFLSQMFRLRSRFIKRTARKNKISRIKSSEKADSN